MCIRDRFTADQRGVQPGRGSARPGAADRRRADAEETESRTRSRSPGGRSTVMFAQRLAQVSESATMKVAAEAERLRPPPSSWLIRIPVLTAVQTSLCSCPLGSCSLSCSLFLPHLLFDDRRHQAAHFPAQAEHLFDQP